MNLTPKPNRTDLPHPLPGNKSRFVLPSNALRCSSKPATCYSVQLTIPREETMHCIPDDVHTIGWLEAMRSSSPPKKLNKDLSPETVSDETDVAYNSWALRLPSALTSFGEIMSCAKGKHIALFLDYDGTLSPIVDDPDKPYMSSEMRTAVKNVAKYMPTAIVSGRFRDKVYEFVGLPKLYYARSHGIDIIGPARWSKGFDC